MISITDKSRCSGCSACGSVCPKHCIALAPDTEGFLYPEVDRDICVDCHLCEKVCPLANSSDASLIKAEQLAAFCKDDAMRRDSSSGGVFFLLAKEILNEGGCVYGAAFDEEWMVRHICITKVDDLHKIRQSKYLQSDMWNCFLEIKRHLAEGRRVLFCGCPCQVNGLLSVIGKRLQENLVTVDFVCHGVPSPKIWRQYVGSQKERMSSIRAVSFRHKKHGWKTYSLRFDGQNGESMSQILTHDRYMQMFLRNLILRPSCYACNQTHRSDLTLADYWTIAKRHPKLNDDKGISKVLVNTEKGRELWNAISEETIHVSDGVVVQKRQSGRPVPKRRKSLFADIDKYDFDTLYDLHVRRGFVPETANYLKGIVKIVLHYMKVYV